MRRAALAIGSTALAVTAFPMAALAAPPDVFKDAQGNVYIHGTTATGLGQQASATTSETLSRRVRAGYCGEVRLAETSTLPNIGDSWTVSGSTRTRASLPVITDRAQLPRCSGNAFTPALSGAITTAGGFVDSTTTSPRVFLVGYTPGISYDVAFNDVNASQNLRPNACGFFRIANTDANPVPAELTISSTTYTVSTLQTAAPPLCQRVGNTYIRYNPTNW